jgi:hypothetical protein
MPFLEAATQWYENQYGLKLSVCKESLMLIGSQEGLGKLSHRMIFMHIDILNYSVAFITRWVLPKPSCIPVHATIQLLSMLQYNYCPCYNPITFHATIQLLSMLQYNYCPCYNTITVHATIQLLSKFMLSMFLQTSRKMPSTRHLANG